MAGSRITMGLIATVAALAATPAMAAAGGIDPATIIIPDSGDSALVYASLLITLITAIPGIILYCAGAHGRAALLRMATAAMASVAIGTLLFFLIGYSLSFDISGSVWLGGGNNAMLNAMGTVRDGTTISETAFVLLQWLGVAMALTLLGSLLAQRARPGWLLCFSGLWLLLVLVPIMRWMWGGGWLAGMGAVDAAGGLTLLFTAACSGLVAMVIVGRPATTANAVPDDALHLSGAALLCVGIAAFAAGSTLGAGDDSAVAMLAVLTAATTGALMSAALSRAVSPRALADGMLAGTVAAAVAGDGVSIGSAWLIGALAALAAHIAPRFMPKRISWADQGGVATRVAGAAKVGALLTAIFLSFEWFTGSGYAEGMTMTGQLVAQLAALLTIAAWAAFGTTICALMVGLVLPMRRAETDGETGTDADA